RLAVILVHDDGNMWVGFDGSLNQVFQEAFARVLAGTGGGLHDDRAVGFSSGFHDGLDLFKVVDVKRGNTITVLGCVVEQLAHGNKGHEKTPESNLRDKAHFTRMSGGLWPVAYPLDTERV